MCKHMYTTDTDICANTSIPGPCAYHVLIMCLSCAYHGDTNIILHLYDGDSNKELSIEY